ncbi:hypothetical protein IKE72_01415 [Candidatus Saccharibacteria bacterium]|nr:hypothetical protein [Candidatus Saccharibacteria bacterium]
MSGRIRKIKSQASESTSNKRFRRKRDILLDLPHSEFLGIASTFSGLVFSLLLGLTMYNNTHAASSISITLRDSVNLNLLGGSSEGSFGKSTSATASVETNNYTGYTLTIMGNNSDGSLVSPNNSANKIPSISAADANINETTFQNDAKYMNTWGFRPSHLYVGGTTIENSNYQVSPTSNTPLTIDVTKAANTGDANEYTLALAAKVDSNTPNDSYTGTFTLAATSNDPMYHIAYADLSATIPEAVSGTSNTGSVTLSTQYPSKYGYTFVGWCTVATTDDSCSGTIYQPGSSYTLPSTTTDNEQTFYAMWKPNYGTFDAAFKKAGTSKVNGYYPMQSMSETICNNVTIGTTGTLIDTRDNRTYEVIKYADNNCWMHQNLELTLYAQGDTYATDKSTGAVKAGNITVFDNSNTNITNNATYNVSSFYATQSKAATTSGDSNFSWDDDGNDGGHSFSWVAYDANQAYAIPTGSQNTYGQNEYTTSANGAPSQRGGNLYNWTMATLGSGKSITTDGTAAPNSICPKGWKLPDNSGSKSFYNLLDAYYTGTISSGNPTTTPAIRDQQNLMQSDPLDFVVSGVYYRSDGTIGNRTTEGSFWSGTAYSATLARSLHSYSAGFYPQDANYRGLGYAVRCVAR